ncbi:hypothetical protein AAC387_Pa11g2192 [Persea americana]
MHDAPVKELAWVPEMNLLVTGSWDKTLSDHIASDIKWYSQHLVKQLAAGNGWDGGTKAKSKSGKGPESGVDSAHATGDQSATPTSMAPSQNLTPSAVSGWLVSRTMDVSSDEMDIDLTRGLHFSHSVKAFGSNVYNLNLTLMWKRTRMCITAIK